MGSKKNRNPEKKERKRKEKAQQQVASQGQSDVGNLMRLQLIGNEAFYKGIELDNLGKHEEAIECYGKAIEKNPNNIETYNNKGIALANLGKHKEAIECYDKAIEKNPNFSEAYNNKGNALANLGKHKEAIECYDKVIEKNPNYSEAYNNKGIALADLGKNKEAIECFGKAIEINPNNSNAYSNKGIALANLGKHKEAIEYYDKAIEKNPNFSDTYNGKGIALASLGKHKEAIECYDNAIEINPNNSRAYNSKGNALSNLGKYKEAIECYDKAIECYGNAIECFDKAIEINPDFANAYYSRGYIYHHQKKYDLMIKDFYKAISLGTNLSLFIFQAIYSCFKDEEIKEIEKDEFTNITNEIINHDMKKHDKPEQNILYKYRPYSTKTLEDIINDEISLSDFNYFNDPADPPIKLDKKKFKDMEDITNKIRIACLSENYDNIVMWSHYADSHKGLCIEYNVSDFKYDNYTIKKVIYNNELKLNDDHSFFNVISENKKEYYFLSLFYLKHINWEYENEYRIISYYAEKDNLTLKVKAIYFGKEATNETINTIYKLIEGKGITLYKMETDKNNLFKIEKYEITEKDIIDGRYCSTVAQS